MDGNEWHWEFGWKMRLYSWELTQLEDILNHVGISLPTRGKLDKLVWKAGSGGGYNSKSFIEVANQELFTPQLNAQIIAFIWQKRCPPRANIILWFLAKSKLKTGELLNNMGIISQEQAQCPF